jgi:thiol:disulfide interchange protein
MLKHSALAAALLLLVGPSLASAAPPPASSLVRQDLYLVSTYDPSRNAEADLTSALALAQSTGRNVLLDVGGDWCVWCHILDRYLAGKREVGDAFAASFVIVKINWSPDNKNTAFLSRYPKAEGYPHFIVLAPDGKLLESKNTAELEQGDSYNRRKMLAFAKKWRVLQN